MADISDVENVVANIILSVFYPAGPPAPTQTSLLTGTIVDIRRGWPTPNHVDAALKSGITLVRVYSEPGMTRNTTRFIPQSEILAGTPSTFSGSVSGHTVTFSGFGQTGVVAGVAYGPVPNRHIAVRLLASSDTPTSVADAFASLLPHSSASLGTLTLPPTASNITVRSMIPVPTWLETRRQDQGIRVSVRCSDPGIRDLVASLIDAGIANQLDDNGALLQFFLLPDGGSAWIRYRGDYVIDQAEKAGLLQRDLCYMAEYPTTLIQSCPLCLFIEVPISPLGTVQPILPAESAGTSDTTLLLGLPPESASELAPVTLIF